MPVISDNKYLDSLLHNLTITFETETNYSPLDIELDPQHITPKDIDTLLAFVKDTRKRLFIFKIPGDELNNKLLALTAHRSILEQTAETNLESTSSEVQINPLKQALQDPLSGVRVGIQIQKSYAVPKPALPPVKRQQSFNESIAATNLITKPIDLPDFPSLVKQLHALGINQIHDIAAEKIKEHAHAFTDGIVPNNLPIGFYIDSITQALCFTETPRRLPTALAPALKKPDLIAFPTVEEAQAVLTSQFSERTIIQLLNTKNPKNQKNALISALPIYGKEVSSFLQSFKSEEGEFLIPILAKFFLLGGESHTVLFVRLLKNCINKKISLEFLRSPEAQDAFLSPRGIKNLQKLLHLPAEQREWWNNLVLAHLKNKNHHFDFNSFFEAYNLIFLHAIAEKRLTLPQPYPINHDGHLLITLNRVLDVLDRAKNPQEQCLSLADLNWGPTGVHFAMTHSKPELEQLKQVASCMRLETPEDIQTNPHLIYQQLDNNAFDLKPWLFRFMGQHWKDNIRLTDIQSQLDEIQKLVDWPNIQKNYLLFIVTCTFSDKTSITPEQWQTTLDKCINLLKPLDVVDRNDLLQALTRCYLFKPVPSLSQIELLAQQCLELKKVYPTKNFKNELIVPLVSCLENEGFEFFKTVQERIQKTEPTPADPQYTFKVINTFTLTLQNNREKAHPEVFKLLAKLNEPQLTQENIDRLLSSLQNLLAKKGSEYQNLVLRTLSQINISKSNPLPKVQQILDLINALAIVPESLPGEFNTPDKQEVWLKELIFEKNMLPGCVLGNGDISKLDDLLVDALVDAVKKRSAALDVNSLKTALLGHLQSPFVPQQLRNQLDAELMPLFEAVNALVSLLQTPNPKFSEVIERLRFFEEKKPLLLGGVYSVGPLGSSKGEYLLSFLLTGKRREDDKLTGAFFAGILGQVHNLILSQINTFFNNEQNKLRVKDLDPKTCLSWMNSFNETHALTFFFREELVQKKVVPALRKTLKQLNTEDLVFEKSILDAAAEIEENAPSDQALLNYKNKIESIANYLNLLIEIKDKKPDQFNAIYKQLNSGALIRLNFNQKQVLISELLKDKPEAWDLRLKLFTVALEENPEANEAAIDRAINGLVALFKLSGLEPETQLMFFNMSLKHNLNSTSPFPLSALSEFKKSLIPEDIKSQIIKQIIYILSRMQVTDSPDLIHTVVQQIQIFLCTNLDLAPLCIALLKRISLTELTPDLNAYPNILHQLSALSADNKGKLAKILMSLANNKKDDNANLVSLLEIAKGLGRRSTADIQLVLQLFATPPYPTAQNLNSALMAHDSEKLQAYCLNFDKNPFANRGEKRDLATHFATDRVKDALLSLKDLLHGEELSHELQLKLAQQMTYIETLGYTDPLDPNDFGELKKLTNVSRHELKERAVKLLTLLRDKSIASEHIEFAHLELLANLREIYFRTTGLFPNTSQMLVLLLALNDPTGNLLMQIKTGEGKSVVTPILSVLQWTLGGTVDQFTANPTLLGRDFENNCEPFFHFLEIKSAIIRSDSRPEEYQLDGINCSTVEDMCAFRMAAKEANKESLVENRGPIHTVLDECHDALLEQKLLYKLVAAQGLTATKESNPAQWIYSLAYQFINLPAFRNLNSAVEKVWDEEEDVEQFRLFLNKQVNGDIEKLNFLMSATKTQLLQWINASCKAAKLIEDKHFIIQPIKVKNARNETIKINVCVPLIRSTPKTGSILTEGVQQALEARLNALAGDQASHFVINPDPRVLASLSAQGLIKFYQSTKGRLIGISATPGDQVELQSLATVFGTRAVGIAPHAGDTRINHAPVFTFSRQESIDAIHNAIDEVRLPITKPKMVINTNTSFQTYEERESLIGETKRAIEEWSLTQTQPILIFNETFDDSKTLEPSLEKYKKLGFTIQMVTGKETPEELNRIIKKAGQVNTITVGTAMLAQGIDIDTGNHPKGLLVIQNFPDTERMTTQIGGRAARNGKPGEWRPIYQVKPPQTFFEKLIYYIFPWHRQSVNELAVTKLQNQIKLQSTVDRLYTEAIDETQRTLMQQIHAWESLLNDLYPDENNLQHELYQWRETVFSELNRLQSANITQQTLETSILQFKNAVAKVWENLREDKWVAKTQKAPFMSEEQKLRFTYLKQIDLVQEFDVQKGLQEKAKPFIAGTKALMHHNLDTMIRDKAGAVLHYTNPTVEAKKDLVLAQSRQLLPNLIAEFCNVYPPAIKTLIPKKTRTPSFFPEILIIFIEKVIEQKNRILLGKEEQDQITRSIVEYYQKELLDADDIKIKALLEKLKPLILAQSESVKRSSLSDQFKMQGLMLTYTTLYDNFNLPKDEQLITLKISYHEEIMKKLAEHLLNEFAWVNKAPQPLHVYFEREVAKRAAHKLYSIAEEVKNAPRDEQKIRALYTVLQEQRVILQDTYLFSFGHTSPRQVINTALAAIDSLNVAPQHCSVEFRNECHDAVLAEFHLKQFRDYLKEISTSFNPEVNSVWTHLLKTLMEMSQKNGKNQSYLIQELHEAVDRFKTYEAYKPYLKQLNGLSNHLGHSLKALSEKNVLKLDAQEILLQQKASKFARLFNVSTDKVRIQNGTDGLQSFIELQIEETPLKEGFTGYESSFLTQLDSEQGKMGLKRMHFDAQQHALLHLSDPNATETIKGEKCAQFEKLFVLKALLAQDWGTGLTRLNQDELPQITKSKLQQILEMQQWNWTAEPIDLQKLQTIFGSAIDSSFSEMLNKQSVLNKKLEEVQTNLAGANQKFIEHQKKVSDVEESIKAKDIRLKEPDCGWFEKTRLNAQILAQKAQVLYFKRQLSTPEKQLAQVKQEEVRCKEEIKLHNTSLDRKRLEFVSTLTDQAKETLDKHIHGASKKLVEEMQAELQTTDDSIATIREREVRKSRYQTRRFFTSKELLSYEAQLANERNLIPGKSEIKDSMLKEQETEKNGLALT